MLPIILSTTYCTVQLYIVLCTLGHFLVEIHHQNRLYDHFLTVCYKKCCVILYKNLKTIGIDLGMSTISENLLENFFKKYLVNLIISDFTIFLYGSSFNYLFYSFLFLCFLILYLLAPQDRMGY